MKIRIKKTQQKNPKTGALGFATRVVTNGTKDFAELTDEASANTTMHKKEMEAAIGIFLDAVAKYIKQGYIVSLGELGKLYPAVTGKWTATAEEQTKDLLTAHVNYAPSDDIGAAIRGAQLQWVTAAEEGEDDDEEEGGDDEGEDEGGDDEGDDNGNLNEDA